MGKKAAHRPTIGLLIESTAGKGRWYLTAVWTGVADAVRERDANLLCFAGGVLRLSPFNEYESQRNLLFDLVTPDTVDGLIISSTLGTYVSREVFESFCNRYCSSLPVVSIAAPLPNIPTVLVNNGEGVRQAVRHLYAEHGRRRIAFIRGPATNPEAEVRYQAYCEALAELGLSLDPALVALGDFEQQSGSQAIDTLLDQHKVTFDAVLAANDPMALGALERLKAQEKQVPDDVAVVGFDGVEEGETVTPPLTTVRQPVRQQAKQAVEMLLDLLAGKQVPPQVILPTEVVVRQSCGCVAPAVVRAVVGPVTRAGIGITPVAVLTATRETILAEIIQAMRVPPDEAASKQAGQLLDALIAELKGETPGAFLSSLESTLYQVVAENGDVAAWQDAISVLRRHTLPYLVGNEASAQAEDLWQQARVVIADITQRERAYRKLQAEQQAATLREIGEAMVTTVEVNGLMDVVAEALPRVGIPGCYISLYEPDAGEAMRPAELPSAGEKPRTPVNSRLILAYGAGKRRREAEGRAFPSHQLVPDGVLDRESRFSMVVEPLHFRERQLGFALFEMGPREGAVYEALRGQISSALQGALLVRQVQQGQEYLRSLYEASGSIISLQSPQTLLQDIVERTCKAAGACQADVMLVDTSGRFQRLARGRAGERVVQTATLAKSIHISQEVIRTNEPVLIEDVQDERQPAGQPLATAAVGAAGCFPLCCRGKPIGVMWIYYPEPRRFSQAEIDALKLYANQVAIAYDNARRMRELEHLRQAAEKLASVTEVQAVLHQIAMSAKEVLEADSTVIWSYDANRETFIPSELVATGVEPEVLDKFREDVPQPGGTATIVIKKGYLAVSDVDAPAYAYLRPPAQGLREEIGVKAFQGIALQVESKPLGVLYVNYRQPREFDEEAHSTLEAFAHHAALALKKARLLEEVRRAHDTAQVVAEAGIQEKLQRTLDTVATGTKDAVRCDVVTLYVYNPATKRLDQPPAMAGVWYPDRTQLYEEVALNSIVYEMLRQDKPYVVEVTAKDALFRDRRFVKDEQIESCVAVPLQAAGQKVGVMFVNYRTRHHFTGDELADVELFAHQAAAAIRNAQLYEEASRRAKALEAICEASRAITGTLMLGDILNHVVEQALRLTAVLGEPARVCHLALKEDGKLRFTAAYPPEHLPGQAEHVIDLEHDKPIGISGRAVKTGQSQLVDDVTRDPDYIAGDQETRSELAVPLKWREQVIGIIDVQHPERNAFDVEDQRWLELLAAQAAIAIQNARQYEELTRTKGMVGARTALAWIGMTSAAWWHTIGNRAVTIAEQVDLLRKDLQQAVSEDSRRRIYERVSMIQELARQISERPIIPPLAAEEGALSVPLNELIRERTKQLWQSDPYRSVTPKLNLTLDDKATVRASPEWLRRALDILLDNAIHAMADFPQRQVTIETHQKGNQAEILVRDTGKGIPPEVLPHLFVDPIEKPIGTRGLGIGLLMAQVIVQTYRGEIGVETTGPTGTTMFIRLPLEAPVSDTKR